MTSFRGFYTENKERLFGYLLRKTGNYHLAADLMQESFTRYFEQYKDKAQNPALLFTISRNLFYDHVRKKRDETPYDDELHGTNDAPEKKYQTKEEYRRILTAIQQLGEEEQDILALAVSSGLSYKEIAGITDNSVANIKVKIHRARVKLKIILQQDKL